MGVRDDMVGKGYFIFLLKYFRLGMPTKKLWLTRAKSFQALLEILYLSAKNLYSSCEGILVKIKPAHQSFHTSLFYIHQRWKSMY